MNAINELPTQPDTRTGCRISAVRLIGGLLLVFVIRAVLAWAVNLIPDECSYWAWSRRLDWSYFDNSGMVAWLIRLSTALFGESSPLSVRFPFLVLSVAGTFLIYCVSVLLFHNRKRALLAALLLNTTPVALLGGAAAVHDNAQLFFWIACLWAAARFLKNGDSKWFYVIGVCGGLAILSKYTGVLVLPCLLGFLLWNGTHRKWLLRREPWIGVLIAAAFTLPIVVWNVQHGWASLHHILFIGTGSSSVWRKLVDGIGYNLAQFLLLSPLFYFGLVVALAAGVAANMLRPKPEQALLLCFSLPLLFFAAMSFKGHVEANWGSMGYISAAILAVEVIAHARGDGREGIWRLFGSRFLKWAVILSVVPVALVALHAWIGLLPAALERKIGKADRIVWETRGWDGLGRHVANLRKDGDVIAADTYQLCALLEFNVPGQPFVRYLAPWNRPTQFDVWEPSFDNLSGRNILFVSNRKLEPSSDALKTIYENFGVVEPLPSYHVTYHGESIREIYLCRGHNFNPDAPLKLGPRSLFYRDY
ncbi:MAG: glycosyltransferase family 39 protein [Desulfomonile sp.]|nr:glycosyltransferase family 39 protein [Desulfomonile sp.]